MQGRLFILLFLIWGCSFVAIKFALMGFPPFFAAAMRMGVAIGGLAAFYLLLGKRFRVPREIALRIWITGLFMLGFPFALLFWGEQYISAGLAGIINGTVPVWIFIFGLIFMPKLEPFSMHKLVGLCLGVAGIVLICLPSLQFSGSRGELLGAVAVFGMALCYMVGALSNRFILNTGKVDLYANLFQQHLVSVIFLFILSASVERWSFSWVAWEPYAAIMYLGLVATALAFLIYYYLLSKWGALRATAVTYVVPLVAIGADVLFFGSYPRMQEFLGILLVLTGVISIQAPALRQKFAKS